MDAKVIPFPSNMRREGLSSDFERAAQVMGLALLRTSREEKISYLRWCAFNQLVSYEEATCIARHLGIGEEI